MNQIRLSIWIDLSSFTPFDVNQFWSHHDLEYLQSPLWANQPWQPHDLIYFLLPFWAYQFRLPHEPEILSTAFSSPIHSNYPLPELPFEWLPFNPFWLPMPWDNFNCPCEIIQFWLPLWWATFHIYQQPFQLSKLLCAPWAKYICFWHLSWIFQILLELYTLSYDISDSLMGWIHFQYNGT